MFKREILIIQGNCRKACLGWGGRPQFDYKLYGLVLLRRCGS
jgi:hypothetical protein